jgi:hypothetical protein
MNFLRISFRIHPGGPDLFALASSLKESNSCSEQFDSSQDAGVVGPGVDTDASPIEMRLQGRAMPMNNHPGQLARI